MSDITTDKIMAKELASARDWDALIKAILNWSEQHMDQWERFKVPYAWGTIYVSISCQPSAPEGAYDEVSL